MTTQAYAIARNGILIPDTIRPLECDAKMALIRLVKRPGIGWRDLERDGYCVVQVTVEPVASRPSRGRRLATHGGA